MTGVGGCTCFPKLTEKKGKRQVVAPVTQETLAPETQETREEAECHI